MAITKDMASKYTVKDSVFRNLFGIKKYAAQLYMALHPEETVTEDDIEHVTLESVIMAALYNDVGFMVRDRIVMLVEQQSSWSENILIRMFIYLAETYYDYFKETNQSLYSSAKVTFPKPELYVIYTNEDKKNVPDSLSLSQSFMGGDNSIIDVKVKIITDGKSGDIIQQYVRFTKIYNQQVKLYGRTAEAVSKTIRICKDENVLSDYMKSREKEVSGIMLAFSDIQYELNTYVDSEVRIAKEKSRAEGRAEGKAEGKLEGFLSALTGLVKKNLLTVSQAAEQANMSVSEFEERSGLKSE